MLSPSLAPEQDTSKMTQLNKTNVFIIDFMIHKFIEKALYSKLIINVKKAIITPEYYYHDKKQTHIFKS